MQVKLIALTEQVFSEGEKLTAEQLIVHIARVSNPANQNSHESAPNLIRYLIDHKHWSPFEQADMTVEIKTSRAIAAQILRHWSLFVQEFSQRYAKVTGGMEDIQLRKASSKNRQGSVEKLDPDQEEYYQARIHNLLGEVFRLYDEMCTIGIATECARMILPLATTTTMYLKGTVRDWIHYLNQRTDPHAQLEHRQVAEEIKTIFKHQFPNISKALLWH